MNILTGRSPVMPGRTTSPLTLLFMLAVGLAFALYAAQVDDGGVDLCLIALLLLPAITLAAMDSRGLVPYVLAVWAFGPEVRRVVDWSQGQYHSLTLLSLAPLLVTATLLLPIARRPPALSPKVRQALTCLVCVLAYGLVVGAARNGFAVFYDFANYALPALIVVYAASRPADPRERDFWIAAFSTLAVAVAAYAWVQFLTAPDWDIFWMRSSGMGSLGQPAPLKIRVFSTLSSPGPAGMFLAAALAPMLLKRSWRGPFGWAGALLVASALALTLVRSAWLMLTATVVVYAVLSGGAHRWRTVLGIAVAGAALFFLIPLLPGGQAVTARAQTFGALPQDSSFNARQDFTLGFVPQLLAAPLGVGLGAVGVGAKINSGMAGPYLNFDNGYWAILFTFGLGGAALFFGALWTLGGAARDRARDRGLLPFSSLAVAALAASLVGLTFVNVLAGATGVSTWLLVGCAFGMRAMTAGPTEARAPAPVATAEAAP